MPDDVGPRSATPFTRLVAPDRRLRAEQHDRRAPDLAKRLRERALGDVGDQHDDATFRPCDPRHLGEQAGEPHGRVALDLVLLTEREVRHARGDRAVGDGQPTGVGDRNRYVRIAYCGPNRGRVGVAPGRSPARAGCLLEDRPRPAARVEQPAAGLARQPHHRRGHRRAQRAPPLRVAAAVLAHAHVGHPDTGDEGSRAVLEHPDLDLGGIGEAPPWAIALDEVGERLPQRGAPERTLLEHAHDHPEGGAAVDPRPDRAPRAITLPDPSRDPARVVTVGAPAAADLDEQVFGGADVVDTRVARAFEQHQVGPAVVAVLADRHPVE